jgi:hypothetical protein
MLGSPAPWELTTYIDLALETGFRKLLLLFSNSSFLISNIPRFYFPFLLAFS